MWSAMIILLLSAISNASKFDQDDSYVPKSIPEDWNIQNPSKVVAINAVRVNVSTIKAKAFKKYKNLQRLTLKGKIDEIQNEAFDGLLNIKEILLNGAGIKNIKDKVFNNLPSTAILDLSDNEIETIKIANLQMLEVLLLNFNKISELNENSFINLQKVYSINLGNNNIKTIHSSAFNGCPMLKSLQLGNNNIDNIKEGVFRNLKKLESLNLNNNKLREITGNIFIGLSSLKKLYLSRNKLYNIDEYLFQHLTNLTHLDLSINTISVLNQNLLSNLNELTDVWFDKNFISNIDANFFRNTPKLNKINFSYNKLLEFKLFDNLVNLSNVNLGHNKIMSIKWSDRIQKTITHLNLTDNNLNKLDESFKNLNNLQILSLKNNKLKEFCLCIPRSLIHLDLSRNEIDKPLDKCFHEGSCKSFKDGALKEIDLSSNCLTYFNTRMKLISRDAQPHLEIINLTNNALTDKTVIQIQKFNRCIKNILIIDALTKMDERKQKMIDRNHYQDDNNVDETVNETARNSNDKNITIEGVIRESKKQQITWIAIGCAALLVAIFAVTFGTINCMKIRNLKSEKIAGNHEAFNKQTTTSVQKNEGIVPQNADLCEVYEINSAYVVQDLSHYEIVD